eukprot:s1361_g8.t1
MVFFVKKTDGLLVMDEPAGSSLDVQLMWQLDCVPPTVQQLESMTGNSLVCFPHQVGWKVSNALAGGKKSLAEYLVSKWGVYVEKVMGTDNITESPKLKHKGKAYFIENQFGMYPIVIKAGVIVELDHLANYTAEITKDMLQTLTINEIRWSMSHVFGHLSMIDKTHDQLVNRLYDIYDAHITLREREMRTLPINDDPASSCDEGDDEIEDGKDAELQEEVDAFATLFDKFVSMDFATYLASPADFDDDDLVRVDIHTIHDGRWLFALRLPLAEMTAAELKGEVLNRLREVQTKKGSSLSELLDLDSFFLSAKRFQLNDMETIEGIEGNRIYLGLRLRGGGLVRQKDKKEQKQSLNMKALALKEKEKDYKDYLEKSKQTVFTVDALKNAGDYVKKLEDMSKSNPEEAFEKLLEHIPTGMLDCLMDFNSNKSEVKKDHIIMTFMNHAMPDMDALAKELENVQNTAYGMIDLVISQKFMSDSGAFQYAELASMIDIEKKARARVGRKSTNNDVSMG